MESERSEDGGTRQNRFVGCVSGFDVASTEDGETHHNAECHSLL